MRNFFAGTENNFEKASSQTTDNFGVGYDYGSVMHYSGNAFSKNGQPTIVAKVSLNYIHLWTTKEITYYKPHIDALNTVVTKTL